MWIFIGIIIFILLFLYLKDLHKVYRHSDNKKDEKVAIPIWLLFILFLLCLIPYFNILAFIGIIIYILESMKLIIYMVIIMKYGHLEILQE